MKDKRAALSPPAGLGIDEPDPLGCEDTFKAISQRPACVRAAQCLVPQAARRCLWRRW